MNEIVFCDKKNCYGLAEDGICHVLRTKWNWKKRPCVFYRDRDELKREETELYGSPLIKPWEIGED